MYEEVKLGLELELQRGWMDMIAWWILEGFHYIDGGRDVYCSCRGKEGMCVGPVGFFF